MKYETGAATGSIVCQESGMTYEVKPSTHMFFQMFVLWTSSGKDRWGREEGAGSESSSAAGKQDKTGFLMFS